MKWDISDLHKVPGSRGLRSPNRYTTKGGTNRDPAENEPKYNFYSLHPRSKRDGDHLLSTEARSLVT